MTFSQLAFRNHQTTYPGGQMSLSARKGQRFHCQNPDCDCEIQITHEPAVTITNPRCVCGAEMKRRYVPPTLTTRPAPPNRTEEPPGKTC
jgi:hypothetical protein